MATATRNVTKVKKMVEVEEDGPETFTLTISREEAVTLRVILANVGGNPLLSRRKFSDAVDAALASAGIRSGIDHPSIPNVPSGIIFKTGVI